MSSATRSLESLNVGTNTTPLRDVEIRVAGRQPLAASSTGRGNGSLTTRRAHCGSLAAAPGAAGCRSSARGCRRPGRFDGEDDRVGADEPRDVVDVPVRVVADAAFPEPDRPLTPSISRKTLRSRRGSARVADLDVAEQPLLGYEEQARAVHVDAAAFEHDAAAVVGAARLLEPAGP